MIAAEVPASKVAGRFGGFSLMSELCSYIIERHREGLRRLGSATVTARRTVMSTADDYMNARDFYARLARMKDGRLYVTFFHLWSFAVAVAVMLRNWPRAFRQLLGEERFRTFVLVRHYRGLAPETAVRQICERFDITVGSDEHDRYLAEARAVLASHVKTRT
jgi:hypothetical protein